MLRRSFLRFAAAAILTPVLNWQMASGVTEDIEMWDIWVPQVSAWKNAWGNYEPADSELIDALRAVWRKIEFKPPTVTIE